MTLIRISPSDLTRLQRGEIIEKFDGPTLKIVLVDKHGQTAAEAIAAILPQLK